MFSFSSCSSVEKDCLNKNQKNTVIIWGSLKSDESFKNSYKLTSDAKITHSSVLNSKMDDKILDRKLSNKEVCDSFNETMGLFLKLQSLNVPADSNCFIEYINPDANVQLRALWNPVHTNKGNKDFKQLFEKLMTLVR
jgi:hypothetical protein